MEKNRNKVRWLYLAVGTAALIFAGIIYGWSILKAPLAEEFGWGASSLSLNFTLTMCFFCFGGMLGGALSKRLGFKLTCIISAVLAGAGFLLTSTLNGSIALLYISYGVVSGLGIGVAYNAVISTVNAWFPDKKGLCSGVLMMGFGSSALILGGIADAIIADPDMGWRAAYRILGIALCAVLFVAALIIKRPEVKTEQKSASETEDEGLTTAEMLKTGIFRKAFILVVFLSAVGNSVISTARDIALSVGITAATATTLVGVLSVCNGLGRIITGAVFDKFGRRTTMISANICAICAAGISLLAVLTNSVALCTVGLCLAGLSYGTCPTISSAFISEVFGQKHFAMNFSVMNCSIVFASLIATLTSLVNGAFGGFAAGFVMLLALCLAAMGLNLSIKE